MSKPTRSKIYTNKNKRLSLKQQYGTVRREQENFINFVIFLFCLAIILIPK